MLVNNPADKQVVEANASIELSFIKMPLCLLKLLSNNDIKSSISGKAITETW